MTSQQPSSATPTCVGDIMITNVVTLATHNTFEQAVALMANYRFRHFVVVDVKGRLAGVISDRDILRGLARTTNWQTREVSQFMTGEVVTVAPSTPISAAVGQMLGKRFHCLPVVEEDGQVCGIVTSTDLLKTYRTIQESLEEDHGPAARSENSME